ncbi:MAG: SCP2 sterol-binding domain-containing protein [Proteobacteria bacterium]|nr:SCP2 sterol-binding domain-containing protein [Pseudomonadota bacterium]
MTRTANTFALVLAISSFVVATPTNEAHAASNARIDTVDEYFDGLPERFNADAADKTTAIIQWDITGAGGGSWYAIVKPGAVKVREGTVDEPALTISVGASDYLNILNGEANGKAIFASGRGQVEGSIRLAMKLERIFPLD